MPLIIRSGGIKNHGVTRKVLLHGIYNSAIEKPDLFWFESYGQGESLSKGVEVQGQGHTVINYGINQKVLTQGIHMCNMKALSPIVFE